MTATIRTTVVPFVLTAAGTGVAQHLVSEGPVAHEFDTDAIPHSVGVMPRRARCSTHSAP